MKKKQAAPALTMKAVFAITGIALLLLVALLYQNGISADEQAGSLSLINIEPNTGTAGTEVLVRGQGFSAEDNTVTIGDVTRSGLSSTDGTSILLYIPDGLDTGNQRVSVTNAKGKSNNVSFTVSQ